MEWIGRTVDVIIDRPAGSAHPRWGWIYPINYGYVPGTTAGDGEEIDVYLLDVREPLERCTATIIGCVLRADDVEFKLIGVRDGGAWSAAAISEAVAFQERFFSSRVMVKGV